METFSTCRFAEFANILLVDDRVVGVRSDRIGDDIRGEDVREEDEGGDRVGDVGDGGPAPAGRTPSASASPAQRLVLRNSHRRLLRPRC